ncbi:MAG: two-component system, NarL family, sensor histidine kinase BarA [Halomonadaceae bacterium T82-2]|nr:MAG: two-component system, NarL family, sensor histidine kinase BarA [Halomonadaceae bacterium T82-2]
MTLWLRLLLALLVIPWLLMLALGGWQFAADDRQRREALVTRIEDGVRVLAPFLAETRDTATAAPPAALLDRLARLTDVDAVHWRDTAATNTPPPGRAALTRRDGRAHVIVPLPAEGNVAPPAWLDVTLDDGALSLPRYRQLAGWAVALTLAMLVLGLIALLVPRRALATIAEQRHVLERLRAGDTSARLPNEGPHELALLSLAINGLADTLASSHPADTPVTTELRASLQTIERQNAELENARQQALDASRVKSEFLANVSHEIRTPLNGIIGFCRLLERSPLDARQQEWLENVTLAADNLLSLVNGILDFSKLEAGKLALDTAGLDIAEVIDEVLLLQAPAAQGKGLEMLGLVYDDVPTTLSGDPLRIKQILTNLVHNAVKFTDRGEVLVRVQVEAEYGSRVVLGIRVSDTGVGLAEEIRDQLFQPFVQSEATRLSHPGGTGLGLMICKKLLDQMDGEIRADGTPGGGTTFHVTLPLDVVESAGERGTALDLSGRCLVLVEPHTPSRRALAHLLRQAGAEVVMRDASPTAESLPAGTDLVIEAVSAGIDPVTRARLGRLPCPVLVLGKCEPRESETGGLPDTIRWFSKPLTRARLAVALSELLPAGSLSLAAHAADEAPSPQGACVMIVDDIASNRLLVSELLRQRGIENIFCADSGEAALALARRQSADLVLMDIRMSGMDGIATTTALRRLGGPWRHCPVIALTAHARPADIRSLLASGMQAVLIKPLDEQALDRVLDDYLALPPAPDAAATPARRDTAADDDELPVVDAELGITLAGGRPELAERMLATLLESLDATEAELRRTYESGDDTAFLDAVHHLNGACRYCGVPQLALVAETLESRLRAQGIASVADIYETLLNALQRLRAWQTAQTRPVAPGTDD